MYPGLIPIILTPKILARDGFNGADNPSSLGYLETGQPWTTINAVTWGRSGGRAYISAGTDTVGYAVCEAGRADVKTSLDAYFATNNQTALAFRNDGTANNVFRLVLSELNDRIILAKKVGGGSTAVLSTVMYTLVNGTKYTLKVISKGSRILCFVNNVQLIEYYDSDLSTLTKCGMQIYCMAATPTSTFDNFKVEAA
jgi:hypothetical protein